jgi:Uncharacterized protein conserved in bacteria C-term(DUF2220)/Uncharacterized protein conserved in bacteria N-term (DUF3322)
MTGERWVVDLLEEMTQRWARGDTAYRLSAAQVDATKEFFTLLAAVSRGEARGLDARTFSFRATTDTKAFDRHASRLAAVLGVRIGQPGAASDMIWTHIGLERFSHPIHLKGPVAVEGASGRLVDGRSKPFASIHPEMLPSLTIMSAPAYVLTVENFASFNRQVRETASGGLVVYLGGFPSAGVIALLDRVLSEYPESVPFFHWGDIDSGGLRIFRYLEEVLPRRPAPHMMTRRLAESIGRRSVLDPSLSSIARSDSSVAALAEWLAFGESPMALEQEALDPSLPSLHDR